MSSSSQPTAPALGLASPCRRRSSRPAVAALAALLLVALAGLAPGGVPAAAAEGDEGCFVSVAHVVFLDRPASDPEVASWEDRFATGTPRHRLPQELANGDEWLTVVVSGLYQQALDRDPEADGLDYWIGRLREGAMVNRVASEIYGSDEYYANVGGTTAGFVTDLYHRILHRDPDASGQAFWEGEVADLGRGRVAALFFASLESRGDRVDRLYEQILDRPAEESGRSFWIDRLAHVNDVRLAVLLASSSEFHTRATTTCAHTVRVTRGDDSSDSPVVSADGRYVAFTSQASDLVPGDTNERSDAFTWDRSTGEIVRVTDGDADIHEVSISDDGRHLAFYSWATDLVPGDTNGKPDVFSWDRTTGDITRITDANEGSYAPDISGDGQWIAFSSNATDLVPGDTNGERDVFTWDRSTGDITRITDADSFADRPSISGDGRHVAFQSDATDLVPGDTNDNHDIFTWDRTTGTTTAVTHGDSDSQVADISADGDHITFASDASDLVTGDTNGNTDIFTWDRTTGTITAVTHGDRGSQEGSVISADGTRIAFASQATDLVPEGPGGVVDVFVWDATTGVTIRITDGFSDDDLVSFASAPGISADGRHVAYVMGVFETMKMRRATDAHEQDIFVWSDLRRERTAA